MHYEKKNLCLTRFSLFLQPLEYYIHISLNEHNFEEKNRWEIMLKKTIEYNFPYLFWTFWEELRISILTGQCICIDRYNNTLAFICDFTLCKVLIFFFFLERNKIALCFAVHVYIDSNDHDTRLHIKNEWNKILLQGADTCIYTVTYS